MNDMDWRIIKVLYEQGSMTKAANELFVTQSTITKRLRAMEEEWNVKLVERNSKGVVFTEDGRYLVKKATIILDFYSEIKLHFQDNRSGKQLLRLGVPNSYARLHFPKLMNRYVIEKNNLQFKTVPNPSDLIIKQLLDETIDIGIVCGDYPYAGEKFKLFKEDLYLMMPIDCTIGEIDHMPLIEYHMNPIVKGTIEQWWKYHFGNAPREEHQVPYAEIAIEMVENGLGVCCMFGDAWRMDETKVQLIPLYSDEGEPISRNVWMMVPHYNFEKKEIMNFVEFAQKYYQVD